MIKSQDDLNVQGRKSEVLIEALKKCQELEKENKELKEIVCKLKGMLSVYRISGNVSTYTNYEILALLAEAEKATGGKDD